MRALAVILFASAILHAQSLPTRRPAPTPYAPPPLAELLPPGASDLSHLLVHYTADQTTLRRFHSLTFSPAAITAQEQFYSAWRRVLEQLPFDALSVHGRAEYLTLRLKLEQRIQSLDDRRARIAAIASLLPFAPAVIDLREARERVDPLDPRAAAGRVTQANKQAAEMIAWLSKPKSERPKFTASEALRAAAATAELQQALKDCTPSTTTTIPSSHGGWPSPTRPSTPPSPATGSFSARISQASPRTTRTRSPATPLAVTHSPLPSAPR